MPISSAAAGSPLDTSREQISVRRILAYAAGIGATASPAFDDDREGGVVAMPPFCVSLEWPVVSGARAREGLGAEGAERYRGVHASQDSFFHRPIRPGDDLETRGRIASVVPTRAGALVAMKLETVDLATGETVVTSWSHSIYRGVEVGGEAAVIEQAPAVPSGGDATLPAPSARDRDCDRDPARDAARLHRVREHLEPDPHRAHGGARGRASRHHPARHRNLGARRTRGAARLRPRRSAPAAATARTFPRNGSSRHRHPRSSMRRAATAGSTSWCATTAASPRSIRVSPSSPEELARWKIVTLRRG